MSLWFSKHNVSSLAWIISAEVHGDLYFFKLSNSSLSHKGTRHINRRQFKLLWMDVGHDRTLSLGYVRMVAVSDKFRRFSRSEKFVSSSNSQWI